MEDGRRRAIIENVRPNVDGGRFPIKRTVGEPVRVECDAFADGHDLLAVVLQYRRGGENTWHEVPMTAIGNDRWRAAFTVSHTGTCFFAVTAWVDHFLTWRHDLARRVDAEDIRLALRIGAQMTRASAERASASDSQRLVRYAADLESDQDLEVRRQLALGEDFRSLMMRYADRSMATRSEPLPVTVDREMARFSSWYEFFPRSCTDTADHHGTFATALKRLDYVAEMGFDIVYLPPIHPIGRVQRKGPNNTLAAAADDPGSPWAIGAEEGGHKAVHPALGNADDFRRFVARARELGMEVAMDIAFQAAPDHPYVKEHPQWFRWRPDGSVQYAENPPKKYQDIYPLNFESENWQELWEELRSVFDHWITQGVSIFRVDNPHTKPFPFWEWVIGQIKRDHPDVLFLSEAFARPKIMYRLAKVGFSQSYTYFTWRNTAWELQSYMHELTQTHVREFFRPNFWPNTPDILPEYLQFGGRPAFMTRLVLAATLSSNYGIYGPAFELAENTPREAGSEEYLNSEKYQVRRWELQRRDSLKDFIARVNRIRREHPALQQYWNIRFLETDNDQIVAYIKRDDNGDDVMLTIVSLDAFHTQSTWLQVPLEELGLDPHHPFQVHDLLSGTRYLWNGPRNFVQLDPNAAPAHIMRLRRKVRTEHDFEYFF